MIVGSDRSESRLPRIGISVHVTEVTRA